MASQRKSNRRQQEFDKLEYETASGDPLTIATRISWEFFGTLTFRGKEARPSRGYKLVWPFFRDVATQFDRPYNKLMICLREERGEATGRFHFHYLLAGVRPSNSITASHIQAALWKRRTGGFAQVRPFDGSRAGAAYVLKCLSGEDEYELAKFGRTDRVTFSRSVGLCIRSLDRMKRNAAARS